MPTRPANLSLQADDLTGRTFFGLTALRPTRKLPFRGVVWACRCDCGRQCEETSYRLLRGDAKSCGCHRREKPAGPKRPRGRPAARRRPSPGGTPPSGTTVRRG